MLIQNKTIWTPDNSNMLRYKELCELGTYIIGEDLKTQLANLSEDLKTSEYIYDTEAALLRINFMEHCVRLTKSPFIISPWS